MSEGTASAASPSLAVTVTIRCERDDGQFTIAQTTVPANLQAAGGASQSGAERKIAEGFVVAYRQLMDLPR